MPNHTSNIMTVTGPASQIAALKIFIRNIAKDEGPEKCLFDFDKVIPMPKELQIGNAEFSPKEGSPQYAIQKANVEKYGFPSWYEWSIANWGTKWNSYDSAWNGNVLTFLTAWSPPIPVIAELCKKFPMLEIKLEYADEGGGYVGSCWGKGEDFTDNCHDSPEKGTPEFEEWCAIVGITPEETEA